MKLVSPVAIGLLLLAGPASAQEEGTAGVVNPLFASHDIVEFTLKTDYDQLDDDRSQDPEDRDAIIEWVEPDGVARAMGMKIQTRGKFRLQKSTCPFPPIRLDFKKDSLSGTIWQGQNKLKLVTYCYDRDNYEQNVLEEYLAYRGYNLLTDNSFRVRLAMITYEDTSGEDDPVTRYGFMIENDEDMAARVGGRLLEVPQAHPSNMEGEASTLMALYQFLIGNTDWSMVYFHNAKLVRLPGAVHVPVPYDFDFSGMVDAPYASPDPSLRIRSVRQRVYRGFCRPEVEMSALYRRMREHAPEFRALIEEQPGLEDGKKEDLIEYLSDFWEMLDDEGDLENNIEERCLEW